MYIFVVVSNVPVDTRMQNPVYTRLIKSTLKNTKEEQERQTLVCFNQRGTRTRKRKKNERKKKR